MADQDEAWLRQDIIDTALAMSRESLSPGTSGNVSARWKDGMLITPTGMAYNDLIPEDIVFIEKNGEPVEGARKPSSEWQFHLSAYGAREEAQAIVHTHSRYATALACCRRRIPAFHYMVAVAGGKDIPLADYATFGTAELADNVTETLKDRRACLMANHGVIACGANLAAALDLAREVETLAAQYLAALQVGEPHILDDAEMSRVLERFKTYGQQR
ncbi:MAG: class II aldolase/adducin family protein [Hyphomicrobiaceae bacterium]|nr:class II aldolase/adducin family protein [Hyphomicrobiaceae bacterium]